MPGLLNRYTANPYFTGLLNAPQLGRPKWPAVPQSQAPQLPPLIKPRVPPPMEPGAQLPRQLPEGMKQPPQGLLSKFLSAPGQGEALGLLGSYLMLAGSETTDPGARSRYLAEGLREYGAALRAGRKPAAEPFTLQEGAGRYGPSGELIAERPGKPELTLEERVRERELLTAAGARGSAAAEPDIATRAAEARRLAEATALGKAAGAPPDERTTAQKDAEAMGLQSGTPEYNKYIRDRTTKPGVQIDLGQKAGVARTEALVKLDYERLKGMQEQILQFADLEPRLDTIALGLESGSVETGRIRGALFPLRQIAAEAGVVIDETLPQAEQVRAAMAFLTPRMRVVGSGQTSDFEMRQFQLAAPQFQNSTEGNILLARTFSQVQKRNKKAYDLGVEYFRENGSLAGVNDFIENELGPVFPIPKTQEEFDAIPSGTVYFSEEFGTFVVKR